MSVAEVQVVSRPPRRWKWTIAEFDRLVAEGFLREQSGGPYLWDGEILKPMPENRPHANASENLRDHLAERLSRSDWTIDQDHPIVLREGYKPNPDLAILIGPRSKYRSNTPGPVDVSLLIEVANSTYSFDVGEVLREYARAGIPQYWVVWIAGRCVRVFREPDGEGGYRVERTYKLGEFVPLELGDGTAWRTFEPIGVEAILRDSLEPIEPNPPSGEGAGSA